MATLVALNIMDLASITPLIITFNEEPNLRRCLEGLAWASRIVVVDSGSTDSTLSICAADARVQVVSRPFDTFAAQCNFGLDQISDGWVLSLDADYVAEPGFAERLAALNDEGAAAWRVPFTYCINGKPIRSGLYPPRVVLYRRSGAMYQADGHGHRVSVQGAIRDFPGRLLHDDRKPLSRWLHNQLRYADEEADKLMSQAPAQLSRQDRMRLLGWASPWVMLGYCLIWRRGLLDGWAGWRYAAERTFAELLLCLHILDRRFGSAKRA